VKRSTDRILTTHTGSLPRPKDLLRLLQEREEGRLRDEAALAGRARSAVLDVVKKQRETGLAVVNDGEQGRADYTVYVKDRLTGFSGESASWPNPDAEEFPEWTEMARQFAPPFQKRPACTGPVAWKDWAAVERDIHEHRLAQAPHARRGRRDRLALVVVSVSSRAPSRPVPARAGSAPR